MAVLNTAKVDKYRNDHERRQRTIEKFFIPKIAGVLNDDYKRSIQSVRSNGAHYTRNHLHSVVLLEPVIKLIKSIYLRSTYVEANYVGGYIKRNRLKKFRTFGTTLEDLAPVIDSYFEVYLLNQSALPITSTTRKIITKHLLDEIDSGKSLEQAITDFEEIAITGQGKSEARALRIARSESTRAMSFGGLIGAYMTGVSVDKLWVTSNDERVRGYSSRVPFPHTQLDFNQTGLFGSFHNGEEIKFPGDPQASPDNTVNCRCTMLFIQTGLDEDTERSIDNFLNDMGFASL